MYKLLIVKDIVGNDQHHIIQDNGNNSYTSFPIQANNPNWIAFKKQVLAGAELQDADGNTMTTEEATEFIGTLS
jgi:hypothetical protein